MKDKVSRKKRKIIKLRARRAVPSTKATHNLNSDRDVLDDIIKSAGKPRPYSSMTLADAMPETSVDQNDTAINSENTAHPYDTSETPQDAPEDLSGDNFGDTKEIRYENTSGKHEKPAIHKAASHLKESDPEHEIIYSEGFQRQREAEIKRKIEDQQKENFYDPKSESEDSYSAFPPGDLRAGKPAKSNNSDIPENYINPNFAPRHRRKRLSSPIEKAWHNVEKYKRYERIYKSKNRKG